MILIKKQDGKKGNCPEVIKDVALPYYSKIVHVFMQTISCYQFKKIKLVVSG